MNPARVLDKKGDRGPWLVALPCGCLQWVRRSGDAGRREKSCGHEEKIHDNDRGLWGDMMAAGVKALEDLPETCCCDNECSESCVVCR